MHYISSPILGTAINTVILFQYVNIVLIVKQRYYRMKRLLCEADSTPAFDTSKCMWLQDVTSNSRNRMFSSTEDNLKCNRDYHNKLTIHDL
jgi:hypothetical protein